MSDLAMMRQLTKIPSKTEVALVTLSVGRQCRPYVNDEPALWVL